MGCAYHGILRPDLGLGSCVTFIACLTSDDFPGLLEKTNPILTG